MTAEIGYLAMHSRLDRKKSVRLGDTQILVQYEKLGLHNSNLNYNPALVKAASIKF